jgi:hypothetical protein
MPTTWYVSSEEEVQTQVMGYTRYRELIKDIKAQYPSRRRNEVICPVTGEKTDRIYGLSKRAWELVLKGIELERREESKDTESYAASYFWNSVEVQRPDGYREIENFHLLDFVAELLNQRVGRLDNVPDGIKQLHEIEKRPNGRNPCDTIELNERQAAVVKRWGTKLNEFIQGVAKRSFKTGSSWVQNLATGNLTLEQINQWHTENNDRKA